MSVVCHNAAMIILAAILSMIVQSALFMTSDYFRNVLSEKKYLAIAVAISFSWIFVMVLLLGNLLDRLVVLGGGRYLLGVVSLVVVAFPYYQVLVRRVFNLPKSR